MAQANCAVVGVGQTKHSATRGDVSIAGLVREAAQRALDDAQMTWADIDAVVIGKAPDMFEGVMMPELYPRRRARRGRASRCSGCTPPARSAGRPRSSPPRWSQAGIHERVLTVAFEKQCECDAMWALSLPHAVLAADARRRRRLLRAAHPGVHAPVGRARPHRHPGGAEGPARTRLRTRSPTSTRPTSRSRRSQTR